MTEVKRLREKAGLTQAEAADLLDMPKRTFESYDRGEREPPYQKMDRIRRLLGNEEAKYARPFYRGTAWAEERSRDGSDRLFGAGPGARRPSSSFKRAVREAAKDEGSTITEARAERISMYTLRHSCATHWLREGKSLIWVNRLLRHSQVQTTMEYVHLAGVDLQNMG